MSLRVGLYLCRWNEKIYPAVAAGAATTDDGNRSPTVCACCSLKQRPCNLTTRAYGRMRCLLILLPVRAATQSSREEAAWSFNPNPTLLNDLTAQGLQRMTSSGADRAGSKPKIAYGSCMAMTQPLLCPRNFLDPIRLYICVAVSKRRFFLLMLGSLYVVGDTSVASFFSVLDGVIRA